MYRCCTEHLNIILPYIYILNLPHMYGCSSAPKSSHLLRSKLISLDFVTHFTIRKKQNSSQMK